MKQLKTILAALMVTSLAFGTVTLTGCENNTAEDAGEAIDDAAEDAGDAIEDATD